MFETLMSLVKTKGNTFEKMQPDEIRLFIEKFNCKPDIFKKIFPFTVI